MNTIQSSLQQLRAAIKAAAHILSERKEEVNRLNVFPVPDGDTGTNMSLTMQTVVSELDALPPNAERAALLKAITHGSLMGARGNSGVIVSQILRGICEGLEDADAFDAATIARAAERSVEVAFHAVRKPVEGTILTVLKDAAGAASKAAGDELAVLESLRAISKEAMASVRRTPELLPVLKENGVVDAGGYGLAILLEGFIAALSGEGPKLPDSSTLARPAPLVAIEQLNDWEGSEYLYCTEFLLFAEGLDSEATLDFLGTLGDCELLVGSEPHFKVHVHTNEPGTVLSYMTERGQVSEVHIHNMRLQSLDRDSSITQQAVKEKEPPKPLGFVAVASGPGIARILESQGVDFVVQGGQTMNPSTKDFLDAIAQVNAEAVILFPNNSNIILAAQAAVDAAGLPAALVPTTSVPQSFSALFVAEPEAGLEANVAAMTEAIAAVKTAEITTAIKDSKAADGSPIAEGDVIGIAAKRIEVVGSSVDEVALKLVALIAKNADILTLLAGVDYDDEQLTALSERIEEDWPELEVDCQRGDQPLYPLILAAE